MSDEKSIDDGVPLIFREPERVKIKTSKKPKKKKSSKNKGDLGCALQNTIAKELKALKKAEKKASTKKPKASAKKQPTQKAEQEEKPEGAYKMTPPESLDYAYKYHGLNVPDPYRPLENVENENVKGWINYQKFRTQKYLAHEKMNITIVDDIKKYAEFFNTDEPSSSSYSYEGYVLGPETYEGLEKTVGNTTFTLKFSDDRTELYCKTPRKAERLIFCDKGVRFKGRTVRLNRLKINPRGTYALCEIQDAFEEKKYDCVPLCLKTGTLYDVHIQCSLYGFLCWDSKNNGYYFDSDGDLYYCRLRPKSYKLSQISEPREPSGSWRADSYHFLKGHGMTFRYKEDRLTSSRFTKYHELKEEYYIDFTHPKVLQPIDHIDFSHLRHRHRIVTKSLIGLHDGHVYAMGKDNLGKTFVSRLPIGEADWSRAHCVLKAKQIPSDIFHNIIFADNKILTIENEDLQTVLKIYSMDGEQLFAYKHETPSSFLFEDGSATGSKIRFYASGYDRYRDLYEIDTRTFKVKALKLADRVSSFDLGIKRIYARSADGTKVPMTVLHNKNYGFKQKAPTILYMYGGFGACQKPAFQPEILAWLESGGVYAIAHPRGDGGWTKHWAEAGSRRNLQKTLDDIAACGNCLIEQKITAANKLVGLGASNGGRTVASTMLQNPDLFVGIVSQIPVLDMLNAMMNNYGYQKDAFIDNFGDYFDYYDYKTMYKTSPLHSIKDDVEYPPVLLMAQGKDDRAHPGHALKFLATMLNRAKNEDFYLLYKEDGTHESLYQTEPYAGDADYDVYASMFAFIEKVCKR